MRDSPIPVSTSSLDCIHQKYLSSWSGPSGSVLHSFIHSFLPSSKWFQMDKPISSWLHCEVRPFFGVWSSYYPKSKFPPDNRHSMLCCYGICQNQWWMRAFAQSPVGKQRETPEMQHMGFIAELLLISIMITLLRSTKNPDSQLLTTNKNLYGAFYISHQHESTLGYVYIYIYIQYICIYMLSAFKKQLLLLLARKNPSLNKKTSPKKDWDPYQKTL